MTIDNTLKATIIELNAGWNTAFNVGKPAEVAAFYDQSATLIPPGAAQVSGQTEITQFWQNVIGLGFKNHEIELLDAQAAGDLAFQRGTWSAQSTDAQGVLQSFSGSIQLVYRRQADGGWKALTHMWN